MLGTIENKPTEERHRRKRDEIENGKVKRT